MRRTRPSSPDTQDASDRAGSRGLLGSENVPRLFWLEEEYRATLRHAELAYVERLIADIENGSLDGLPWWRTVHRDDARSAHGHLPDWKVRA